MKCAVTHLVTKYMCLQSENKFLKLPCFINLHGYFDL